MEILFRTEVPALYTAMRIPTDNFHSRYSDNRGLGEVIYHCLKCGTDFNVHHRPSSRNFYAGPDDDIILCPKCGHKHLYYGNNMNICNTGPRRTESQSVNWVPTKLSLVIRETKEEIILAVWAPVKRMDERNDFETTRTEEFRFNIKHRRTEFRSWQGRGYCRERQELGNPFDIGRIYSSVLCHLKSDNLSKKYKSECIKALKVLREAIRHKWKKFHGYKLKGLYVSYGTNRSYMLFPIWNLAYRLIYTEARDLPQWLNCDTLVIANCMRDRFIDKESIYSDLETIRHSKNHIQAITERYNLPDSKVIHRMLAEDMFIAPMLTEVMKITSNLDHMITIYRFIRECVDDHNVKYRYYSSYDSNMRCIIEHLQVFATGRDGSEIKKYLKYVYNRYMSLAEIRDTADMFKKVPKDIQTKARKVKLKELHDWLVTKRSIIKEKGYNLDVPEYVTRRLSMQLDSVKFYLPQHSKELVKGSEIFHNCVKTYSDRVLAGECQIVFMTDDNGGLVACLEVKGKNLVQAKLKYNKPVSKDPVINKGIIEWAEKAGLEIKTMDVDTGNEASVKVKTA